MLLYALMFTSCLFCPVANGFLIRGRQIHNLPYRSSTESVTTRVTTPLFQSNKNNNDDNNRVNGGTGNDKNAEDSEVSRKRRVRSLVKDIAKRVVPRSIMSYAQPDAVAVVLKEATFRAVDDIIHRDLPQLNYTGGGDGVMVEGGELEELISQAFAPVERSLDDLEADLRHARTSLRTARDQAERAVNVVQAAALAQVEGAAGAVKRAEEAAGRKAVAEIYATANRVDVESLAYEDVDFAASEMAPPFLDDDQCLVPGEPVVRVEKAPENSRRIFAGVDIMASVDTVWAVLTDYANLQNAVPNLEVNEVLRTYEGKNVSEIHIDESADELDQCKEIANQLKGAVLKQVGKVRKIYLLGLSCSLFGRVKRAPVCLVRGNYACIHPFISNLLF